MARLFGVLKFSTDGRPDDSSQIDGDVTPAMRHTALVMAAAFYIEGALTAP